MESAIVLNLNETFDILHLFQVTLGLWDGFQAIVVVSNFIMRSAGISSKYLIVIFTLLLFPVSVKYSICYHPAPIFSN